MKRWLLFSLLLAGPAAAQDFRPVLIKPVVDLRPVLQDIHIPRIKTVKVPYSVVIHAMNQPTAGVGSCTLEYKGIVLANDKFKGKDKYQIRGTFLLNDGVKEVQLRCQLDGYEPMTESVALKDNNLNVETCFCTRKLYQDPVVDLEQGIARVRLQIPPFREKKIWLAGRSFVQLTSDHPDVISNSWTGEPLQPEFPQTSFYFALPLDAQVTGVTVKPGRVVGGLSLPLIPKAEEGTPQFHAAIPPRFDEKIYYGGHGDVTVERDARLQMITTREQNIVKVSAPLVDFFAKQPALRYYEDLEIIVNFKSESSCFRPPVRGRDAVDLYHARQLVGLNQLILNPEDVLSVCRYRNAMMMRAVTEPAGPNLVIVAPGDFKEDAERLRAHKETLGIRTSVLYWNGGTAEQLKEKLNDAAQALRPNFMQWVLLLGDVDRIPAYYDTALGDPKHGDYALSAGDVFYTQFPGNAGAYTPSQDPNFSIGRIPAKTVEELRRVTSRIIAFENQPPMVDHYYQSPTIAATLQMSNSQDTGTLNNYAEFMESNVAQRYFQAGFRPERIFRTDTEQPLKPVNWSPSKPIDYASLTRAEPAVPSLLFHMDGSQDLIDGAVKRGTNFLINRGHASTSSWAWPGFSYDPKRFSLFPTDKPPVVFAISCLTGFYDSETIHNGHITSERSEFNSIDPNERFMAEDMLLDSHGALGVVASSRQSKWSFNNRLTSGLARSLIDRQVNGLPLSQHLGDVLVDAKVFAKKITGAVGESAFLENTNRHHLLVYNLFGDPSMELRHSLPLRVQGQPSLQYNADQKTLRVRFRVEALACPGCDLSQQKEPGIAVLMDSSNRVITRGLATPIVGENGENREVVLQAVSSYYGSLLKLHLSNADLIPYQYVIDNRIR
ncbi:C25 family cysteine peptidase [Oligoflexus tunisiensis]|uniref:C25 family cysteine peptidase n=1 Tax=Oligoflexus tunisiensis TaxID=708132 RepID=UPI00114C8F72|nr:C25 family cysteine peptidase [Oligoflexus tunisiensis]